MSPLGSEFRGRGVVPRSGFSSSGDPRGTSSISAKTPGGGGRVSAANPTGAGVEGTPPRGTAIRRHPDTFYGKSSKQPKKNGRIKIDLRSALRYPGVKRYGTHDILGLPRRMRKGYYQVLHGKRWRWEHRVVVERVTGLRLKRRQPIHHIDGNKTNNDPSNLLVCQSRAYHRLIHERCKARYGSWHLPKEAS